MIFVFGFVIGIGFTLTALITMMLYAAAQVDQALDLEFARARSETQAKDPAWGSDVLHNLGASTRADATASAAGPNG